MAANRRVTGPVGLGSPKQRFAAGHERFEAQESGSM